MDGNRIESQYTDAKQLHGTVSMNSDVTLTLFHWTVVLSSYRNVPLSFFNVIKM